MTISGSVVSSGFAWLGRRAHSARRAGTTILAAGLALAGGIALATSAQASTGSMNGAASLQVDNLCTAASPSEFGVSFTATFQTADTGSLDTYSLFLLDGTGTIIGSSDQSISAATFSATTTISVPTTQTPSDGSAYTLVAYDQNTGSPLYSIGEAYESDDFQMASLGFDASALDDSCPGPNSARPTPTITTVANPTNAPFTASISFDVSVTGFDVSDLVVGNGAASAFAGSGTSYSATITPSADGNVTINIPAEAAIAGGGEESNAAPTLTVLYDSTAPQPEFIDAEADSTIEGPITAFLQFNEIVSGVASGQIGVTNGAISDFTQESDQLYSFTLTPDLGQTSGSVVLSYSAGQVPDAAGNLNASTAKGYSANTNLPSVVISTSEVEPVAGAFIVDVVFNEDVTGFDTTDFVAGSFTVDSVAGSGTTYTATLTPTTTGTLSIQIAAGTVIDTDTNGNAASNTLAVEADITAPTVAITTAASAPVGASFVASFTFSKPVTGFVAGDLVLTNATATDFTGSGADYSATILPSASGTVKIDIPGAAAQDAGARDNVAATTFTVQADAVAPTVTMTSSAVGPVSAAFTLNLDFSELFTGFTASDLVVVNGEATNIQRDGDDLTATITPTATGTLTVDIPGGVFQDLAGNDNTASTQFSIASTANGSPTVTIASSAVSPVGAGAFPVTVTFSEAVTGFLFTDIVISNGTSSAESISGNVYSFSVTPAADGAVTIDVPAGVAQDGDLNDNLAATQFSVTADSTAPTIVLTSAAGAPVGGAFDVTLTFSEDMDRVVAGTLTVGNGSVTAIAGSGAVYVATILPTADGTVTVDVATDAATDLAGNGNTAATQFSIAAVLGSPSLAITGPAGPVSTEFTATFTFSESVTGFTLADISVGNGAASGFAGSGAVYTATIIPTADGSVTVDVAAGAAQNGGAVNNAAATQYSVTAASLGPIATISSTTTTISFAGFVQINVSFNEAVSGLVIGDFVVTGASSTLALSGSGTSYSFFANATGAADLVIALPAATVTADVGGAANRLGPDLTIPLFTNPTVAITSAAADPVTGASFDITVTFSESVTGFTSGDLVIDGGIATAFSGSGADYTATIAPTRDGVLTVDIGASAAAGASGGGNTAAPQFTIGVNQNLPQPIITSLLSGTVSGAFDIAVNFDEPVTGFDVSDLTVGNGAAGSFVGSGTAYTATITPAADGAVTVDIAAAAAIDADGGSSLVATQFTITNDESGATPSFSTAASDPFTTSFVLNVAFDEAVTGFAASDLTVDNGTASGLAGSGAAYTVTITPAADGLVTVDMAAGRVEDVAGNDNLVATQFLIIADSTAPSGYAVFIDQDPIFSGNVAAFSLSFTGFEVGATLDYTISSDGGGVSLTDSVVVAVAAGTISGLDGSGLGDGTITLTAALTDTLGNVGADATDTATKDTVDPSVVLSTVSADPVSGAFTIDVVFSESVTGFAVGDLTVGNGAASAFAGSGTTYSATITPAADGAVTVDVAAATAQDAAGNDNTAATQFSIETDGTAPTVALSTVSSDPVSGVFTIDVVFSESVADFTIGDLTVGNGTASAFAGSGTTYSATITPAADGAVTVDVPAGAAQDAAGNDNTAATQFSIESDGTGPTVVLSTVSGDPIRTNFTLDIVFSESVTGFTVGDLSVSNGTLSGFAGSGDTYSVTVQATTDGAVTVDLAADSAADAAGNGNSAATQFSISSDQTAPTVTLATGSSDPVSGAFVLTITFSEDVTGFAVGSVALSNATASGFAGSGDTYTVTITPTADGLVTVDVPDCSAADAAGNVNDAATQFSITNDQSSPDVTLSSVDGDPIGTSFGLDIVFTENVTGLVAGDLVVSNGSVSSLSGSDNVYSATIDATADGLVTVDLAANAAQDPAGNGNSVATQFSVTSDQTAPTVALTTGASDPVSGGFTLTITFSEDVSEFEVTSVIVSNGSTSGFAGSDDVYTVTITPAADGIVTVDVPAGAAQDGAGNDSTAATQFSITNDGTAPSVALSTVAGDPVSGAFTIDIVFSESVANFTIGDLTVGNGAASAFAGSGTTYSATITPTADGAVTVDVAAAAAQDAAGNDNTAASQFSITSDTTAPTLVLSTGSADPVSGAFTLDIVFSESVTGFAIGDLTVGNGAASAFAGSGTTYSATITPAADGAVTVDVAAAAAQDSAGNDNTAASQFSITNDGTAPSVALSTVAGDPVSGAFTIDIVFSEAVANFTIGDLTVGNGVASAFAGSGDTYSATITPAADGAVTVDVAAAAAQDSAGNDNTAATQFSITNDGTAPSVALSTVFTDPVSGAFTLDVVFSESVTGFAIGDLTVGNGVASAFAGSGTTYSATITPTADGAVTVDVAAAAAQDAAGNDNTAASQFSITSDTTAPTLVLSTGSADPVSGAFTLDIVFSESVTGFAIGDLTVGNGAASAFAGSGTTYSATITPAADGAVTVDVAAAAAQDSAGNDNTAASQFSITNDGTAPSVALSTVAGDPVSGAFTIDIVFSESVADFTIGDLTVGNGVASAFAGSGDTYSATITPAADGAVTVDVAAAAAQDGAGNDNTAATQFSISNDGTAPSVILSSASSDPVSGGFTLDIAFSESVTGFGIGDLTVGNGTASAFAGSGDTYSATITPTADGAVTVDVAAAVAQDAAGNDNTAASQFSITSDGTAPSLLIAGPAGTQTGAFTASFTFSESVTGFALGDITVGNGAASALAGSGAAYTATITPAADGAVTVDVAAGVASDSAGNLNTVATQLSLNADISAPTVLSVVVSDADLTVTDVGTAFTVAATFSEALDPAIDPSFAFVGADLSATLSLQSSAWSAGDTVFTASYDLSDSGILANDVDVTVSGGADLAGNVLADDTTPDLFSVELRHGGITIAQTIEGAVDGEFDFTGDLGSFSIATSSQAGSRAFTDLAAGQYIVTPAAEDGFSFDGASCSGGTTSVDGTTGAVTITLAPADAVTCTFAAIADPSIDEAAIPTVELALDSDIDDPTGTSTSFSLSNTGGAAFSFTAATDVSWLDIDPTSGSIPAEGSLEFTITFNAGVLDLDPGTYTANITITETAATPQKPLGASANTLSVITIPVTISLQPRDGTLTIIVTTAPAEAGDGVFNYASSLAELNGLSLSTTGGTASSGARTVLRGSYTLTQAVSEGWALNAMSCTGDTDGGSVYDLDTGTMTIDLDPEETMVCTFANRRDEDFIRQITQSAIRSFMAARADQILTNSPELSGRMRGSRMSATPNNFAAEYRDGRFTADLSTSLSAIRQAAESSEPQMPGDTQFNLDGRTGWTSLDVWAQAVYTSTDDNRAGLDASSTFGLYYLGVDMMASENLLVGALLQWDHAETTTGTYRSEVSGDGWLAGPYLVARLAENMYLDARGAWGRSENEVNPIGLYTDSFDTSRWLLEANLTGEMNSGNWRISPRVGIAYFTEEQDAYTDTLGFAIPSQEITLGRINAGPEIAYRFIGSEGGYFEPFVRLTALWDYDDADVYNAAGNLQGIGGLRADARFGLTAELPNGGLITGEIGVIGLGLGDFEANNAMIRIRLPLSME